MVRLLLVHGRWSYKRNAEIVQYAFYKNLVYSLPNVHFGFASGELCSLFPHSDCKSCKRQTCGLPAGLPSSSARAVLLVFVTLLG